MKFTYAILGTLFLVQVVNAQTVRGVVADASSGETLPGVNILVKGTTTGASTDAKGQYELTVESLQDTLVVSFVGYETQQVPITGRTKVDVTLQPQTVQGEEMVVVGYGTQQKSDLTGSISSISQKDFNQGITNNPEQLMQGKVAGVQIVQRSGDPNASTVVNIRGIGSLRSGEGPLYVVDGVPLSGKADFLDPQSIKSIDVLKDASATAIYGSRGANGVIQITTKGGQKGAPMLSYSGYASISNAANKIDVLNADEFRSFQQEYGDPSKIYSENINTNWQDQILRTGVSQNHVLSYSGGTETTTYRASVNYKKQEGIVYKSQRKNYNGTMSLGQSFLDDRINVDMKLYGSSIRADNSGIRSDAGVSGDLLSNATIANPTYPVYNEDGSLFDFPTGINPLLIRNRNTNFNKRSHILGNIQAKVRIAKGLEYTAQLSASKLNVEGINQVNPIDVSSGAADVSTPEGRVENNNSYNTSYEIQQNLQYNLDLENNSFKFLAGYSYQQFENQSRNWSINDFSTSEINAYRNPGIGTSLTIDENRPNGSASINKLQSVFGRINYNYNSRYFLTATLRADGSSRFGSNKRYGFFPSFSGAWQLADEPFLSGFNALSQLKIRAGWGQTGNQDIPSYITHRLLSVETGQGNGYYFGGNNIPGISLVRAPNPSLHWENSNQVNVGLDFGFMNNKLTGAVDVYNKISSDILFKTTNTTDPFKPTNVFWKNYENMEIHNKGIDVSLDYQQSVGSNFSFDIGGNISFVDNNVTGSPVNILQTGTISGQGLSGITVNGILNNEPVGTFYLQRWIGLDDNGMNKFEDVNGDGVINDADYITAGTGLPDKTFGASLQVNYKNMDLSLNFNGAAGNKLYWNDQNAYYAYPRLAGGKNSIKSTVATAGKESIQNSAKPSTRWLHNASYFRLNNATIGYNLKAVTINNSLKQLRLYVSGQNLFVITDYPGYDPAVDTERSSRGFQSIGIDGTSYPRARTFIFGVKISI